MKKYFLFLLFSFILSSSGFAQIIEEEMSLDGYIRTWLTYLPENYSEAKTYPLVIALHGGGGTAKQLMSSTKNALIS